MERAIRVFEHAIVIALVPLLMIVVLLTTIDLGLHVIEELASAPILRIAVDELLQIFGLFLFILIGVELLETVKAYLRSHVVRVELVLEVALIALARKVIVLETGDSALDALAMAALVLVLAIALFVARRRRAPDDDHVTSSGQVSSS